MNHTKILSWTQVPRAWHPHNLSVCFVSMDVLPYEEAAGPAEATDHSILPSINENIVPTWSGWESFNVFRSFVLCVQEAAPPWLIIHECPCRAWHCDNSDRGLSGSKGRRPSPGNVPPERCGEYAEPPGAARTACTPDTYNDRAGEQTSGSVPILLNDNSWHNKRETAWPCCLP